MSRVEWMETGGAGCEEQCEMAAVDGRRNRLVDDARAVFEAPGLVEEALCSTICTAIREVGPTVSPMKDPPRCVRAKLCARDSGDLLRRVGINGLPTLGLMKGVEGKVGKSEL